MTNPDSSTPRVEFLVLDVLGTLVDQPSGVTRALHDAFDLGPATAREASRRWFHEIEVAQREVVEGDRPFVPQTILDHEAVRAVGGWLGKDLDESSTARLVDDLSRLSAWPDSADGLSRLAAGFGTIGLSNAGPGALLGLSVANGLRWHQLLSSEHAETYKPDPAVYELAVRTSGRPAASCLMVAAHAWDLRAAARVGMRTAYVRRPVGDPPAPEDRFDLIASDLHDLLGRLRDDRSVDAHG